MVLTTVLLTAKPVKHKHWSAPRRKLDITKLKSDDIRLALQQELASALVAKWGHRTTQLPNPYKQIQTLGMPLGDLSESVLLVI